MLKIVVCDTIHSVNSMNTIKKYFKFEELNTNFKTEIVGGILTFLSMCYILFVNPLILSSVAPSKEMVFTGTALACGFGCIIMGLFGKTLLAIGPGMGLNTLFSATIGVVYGFNFSEILAITFISGIIYFILSITGFRTKIASAIPSGLKMPISIGIGLFIAMVGLKESGLVISDPNTIVALGNLKDIKTIITLFGILLLLILTVLKVNKAIIYTLLGSILLSIILTLCKLDTGIKFNGFMSLPSNIDITLFINGFKTLNIERGLKIFSAIFSILFLGIFNVQGTINACENDLRLDSKSKLRRVFIADSIAFMSSSIFCTSPTTTFAETITGLEYGAKSGLATITCGLLFFVSLFFSPLLSVITPQITAPILIFIGISMFKELKTIDYCDISILIPSFFIIVMMPLTYSIINGMAFGLIIYTILKAVTYRKTEGVKYTDIIPPFLWFLTLLYILYFVITII